VNEEKYEAVFLSVYDSLLSHIDYDILCTTPDEHADYSKKLAQIADIYTRDILEQIKKEG